MFNVYNSDFALHHYKAFDNLYNIIDIKERKSNFITPFWEIENILPVLIYKVF